MLTSSDIKRALREAGFEVYRTQGAQVHVAERVRENLIMDSGIRVDCGGAVVFLTRAQRGDFPGLGEDELFSRARRLGDSALDRGYREVRAFVTELSDPGDPSRILDHVHEVEFEKTVASMEVAIDEVRFAYDLVKSASG